MPAGSHVANHVRQGRERRDDTATQHHGDAGENAEQRDNGKPRQYQHRHRRVARRASAFGRLGQCRIAHGEEALHRGQDVGGQFLLGGNSVFAVITPGHDLFFDPRRGPSKVSIDCLLQRLHKPCRIADLIDAGFDRSRSSSTRPWGPVDREHFSWRHRAARADRGRRGSRPAAGGYPQILSGAGDTQERRQGCVRRSHPVFEAVQQRFG